MGTTQNQPHQISNTQRTENKTTDVVIQQHSRKLLKTDVLMSETCWAHKKWNKIASDIKLVFHSSSITIMHGPINIKLKIKLSRFSAYLDGSPSQLIRVSGVALYWHTREFRFWTGACDSSRCPGKLQDHDIALLFSKGEKTKRFGSSGADQNNTRSFTFYSI